MTQLEEQAKYQIQDMLNKQGYPTYSRLLDKLDVKLLPDDSEDIAYLNVNNATIYLNPGLSINQVSVIVRHEILHEYLTHMIRANKFRETNPEYKNLPHDLINIAADYEISNRGYTDSDKVTARGILLKDNVLQGLVTEDEHEDWVDLTFEEMLKKLAEEYKDDLNRIKSMFKDLLDSDELQQQIDKIKQQSSNASDQSDDKSNQNKAQQISDRVDKLDQANEENDKEKNKNLGPFDTDKQQKEDSEMTKQVAELKKALNELEKDILDETDEAIRKSNITKKAKDSEKYRDSSLTRFKDSLNNFIKNAIAENRGYSWNRFNKNYVGSGLIKPGITSYQQTDIPSINVYFDRSASWDSNKTAQGSKAISTLNKYVQRNEIKINLYYFSNNVHSSEQAAINEGGTDGQPILDHIKATRPMNVIILTDSGISDCTSDVTVPGGVWLLFYADRSDNLINHIHGKKLTKIYDIEV